MHFSIQPHQLLSSLGFNWRRLKLVSERVQRTQTRQILPYSALFRLPQRLTISRFALITYQVLRVHVKLHCL